MQDSKEISMLSEEDWLSLGLALSRFRDETGYEGNMILEKVVGPVENKFNCYYSMEDGRRVVFGVDRVPRNYNYDYFTIMDKTR